MLPRPSALGPRRVRVGTCVSQVHEDTIQRGSKITKTEMVAMLMGEPYTAPYMYSAYSTYTIAHTQYSTCPCVQASPARATPACAAATAGGISWW